MKRFLFILMLGFTSSAAFAQYTNLVLEGAGVRGVAYAGRIQELEQRNLLTGVQRVDGTSAGDIAAMTLSLGYTGKEIEDIIYNKRAAGFSEK
jgi:NTE family protein